MRRCLVLVLLLWLPLQFSWAAAAGYCGHEQRKGAAHFGHHAHQHRAVDLQPQRHSQAHSQVHSQVPVESPPAPSAIEPQAHAHAQLQQPGEPSAEAPKAEHTPGSTDIDCGSCQNSSAQPLLPANFDCHLETAPNTLSPTVAQGHSLPVPALIERPKWLPAA